MQHGRRLLAQQGDADPAVAPVGRRLGEHVIGVGLADDDERSERAILDQLDVGAVMRAGIIAVEHGNTGSIDAVCVLEVAGTRERDLGVSLGKRPVLELAGVDPRERIRRLAGDVGSAEFKVIVPRVLSGVKEWRDPGRLGIPARDAARFCMIAIDARECQIFEDIRATVLPGIDVLNLQNREWRVLLMQATILATISSPFPNQSFCGCVHYDSELLRSFRALA